MIIINVEEKKLIQIKEAVKISFGLWLSLLTLKYKKM